MSVRLTQSVGQYQQYIQYSIVQYSTVQYSIVHVSHCLTLTLPYTGAHDQNNRTDYTIQLPIATLFPPK